MCSCRMGNCCSCCLYDMLFLCALSNFQVHTFGCIVRITDALFFQTYEEWKDMLPDFSEYNWVIPDFVWELSEQIDLGRYGPRNHDFILAFYLKACKTLLFNIRFSILLSCPLGVFIIHCQSLQRVDNHSRIRSELYDHLG